MKSKKSKSSSKRRDRSRSPSDDSKSKRSRPRSKTEEKKKDSESKGSSRKSRWQGEKTDPKSAQKSVAASKKEPSEPLPRIKELLKDKEKIVDVLFSSITGKTFQELVPKYLEKRSRDELKSLCLEQLKSMSDDDILTIISGQALTNTSEVKDAEKVEKGENKKHQQEDIPKEDEKEVKATEKKSEDISTTDTGSDTASEDLLELHTTANDESCILEGNEIPLTIKDEVAKDLINPDRDAELLELEMRARAIRALLKAKSHLLEQEVDDDDDDIQILDADLQGT